jgi:uncharacterized protein YjiS (DUF1127 family)
MVWAVCVRTYDRVLQRRTTSDLTALSDHTLRDIGLNRMDLRYGNRRMSFRHDI